MSPDFEKGGVVLDSTDELNIAIRSQTDLIGQSPGADGKLLFSQLQAALHWTDNHPWVRGLIYEIDVTHKDPLIEGLKQSTWDEDRLYSQAAQNMLNGYFEKLFNGSQGGLS